MMSVKHFVQRAGQLEESMSSWNPVYRIDGRGGLGYHGHDIRGGMIRGNTKIKVTKHKEEEEKADIVETDDTVEAGGADDQLIEGVPDVTKKINKNPQFYDMVDGHNPFAEFYPDDPYNKFLKDIESKPKDEREKIVKDVYDVSEEHYLGPVTDPKLKDLKSDLEIHTDIANKSIKGRPKKGDPTAEERKMHRDKSDQEIERINKELDKHKKEKEDKRNRSMKYVNTFDEGNKKLIQDVKEGKKKDIEDERMRQEEEEEEKKRLKKHKKKKEEILEYLSKKDKEEEEELENKLNILRLKNKDLDITELKKIQKQKLGGMERFISNWTNLSTSIREDENKKLYRHTIEVLTDPEVRFIPPNDTIPKPNLPDDKDGYLSFFKDIIKQKVDKKYDKIAEDFFEESQRINGPVMASRKLEMAVVNDYGNYGKLLKYINGDTTPILDSNKNDMINKYVREFALLDVYQKDASTDLKNYNTNDYTVSYVEQEEIILSGGKHIKKKLDGIPATKSKILGSFAQQSIKDGSYDAGFLPLYIIKDNDIDNGVKVYNIYDRRTGGPTQADNYRSTNYMFLFKEGVFTYSITDDLSEGLGEDSYNKMSKWLDPNDNIQSKIIEQVERIDEMTKSRSKKTGLISFKNKDGETIYFPNEKIYKSDKENFYIPFKKVKFVSK